MQRLILPNLLADKVNTFATPTTRNNHRVGPPGAIMVDSTDAGSRVTGTWPTST